MRYSQVAHVLALMALAGPATAFPVNKPITDVDPVPRAHARVEARWNGPNTSVAPYINRQMKKAKQRVAAHDATVKNNKLNEPKKQKPKGKRAVKDGETKQDKRDVPQQEEAAAAAAVLEEPHARLEARWNGPNTSVAPYINRQMKKAKQRVAAHDATVRNNKLNEPKKQKPKGKRAAKDGESKKDKRDVPQQEEEAY